MRGGNILLAGVMDIMSGYNYLISLIIVFILSAGLAFRSRNEDSRKQKYILVIIVLWVLSLISEIREGYAIFLLSSYLLLLLFFIFLCWLFLDRPNIIRWKYRLPLFVFLCLLIALAIFIQRIGFEDVRTLEIRAKESLAKGEIRNLAVALEEYFIENESYPPAVDAQGNIVPFSEDEISSGYVPWLLTTPESYQSLIPPDPFGPGEDAAWDRHFLYAVKAKKYWIMTSRGPDRDMDMIPDDYVRSASGDTSLFLDHFGIGSAVEYDPTNGAESSGDVFRTGP